MTLIELLNVEGSVLIVMTPADWEVMKREVKTEMGNRLWGVEVLASDMWVGPPKALSRSEADDFRGACRRADFRATPVEL